ncbi:DNA-directed RNA polymerase subunit E'' [Candidatus Woesearchaeota archaeon]|nr:MAG: DNA-directed RNA polymerase subunit E'' [Candidatus Woesearchaeota archaeon]
MKKKACKKCRIVVQGDKCPLCNGTNFTTNIKGRLHIIDPNKSRVAKTLGITVKGEYAIRIR